MASSSPAPSSVLDAVKTLAPPGTPLSTSEVAAEFDCTDRTIYNKLDTLVEQGALKTKKVGARARVWWRPVAQPTVQSTVGSDLDPTEHALVGRLLEVSPIGIAVVEPNGKISLANQRAEEILGLTRSEITNRTYRQPEWKIYHEDGTPISGKEHPVTQVFETGDPVFGFEHRIELPDGTERWLSSNSAPLENDEGAVEHVVVGLEDITRQKEREAQFRKQRDELTRLNRVNKVIRSVDQAIVKASTRGEIERDVCERLATSDPYLFAVIGEFSPSYEEFKPRASAGIGEQYLDRLLTHADAPPLDEGIGATAAKTREVQAVQQVTDMSYDFWHETAHREGFRSVASIPIVYEDVVYGVLGVYAGKPDAFDEKERAVLQELGETIGHAFSAIERKEALLSERVMELRFRETGSLASFFETFATDSGGTAVIERTILLEDGNAIQYYTVANIDVQALVAALEMVPAVEQVRTVRQDADETHLEVRTTGETIATVFATYGGHVSRMEYEDGAVSVVAELPFGADIRGAIDRLQSMYPDMEFVSRTTRNRRKPSVQDVGESAIDRLTDRQWAVLEAAYAAGFFNWPRDSTGDDLAASLDIASPTFHKHLRSGERKIMTDLFASPKLTESG